MKPIDLTNVKEAGESTRLPAGGYVVKIGFAEDVPEKEYIKIQYDIEGGEFHHYYADRMIANPTWGWGGMMYKSYKPKALGMFKRFCSCVTKSNPGYLFDGNTNSDEKTLTDKLIGLVLGEEEYMGNDGTIKTRLYVVTEKTVEDIRNGNFKLPAKKLLQGGGFTSMPGGEDESDLPFS